MQNDIINIGKGIIRIPHSTLMKAMVIDYICDHNNTFSVNIVKHPDCLNIVIYPHSHSAGLYDYIIKKYYVENGRKEELPKEDTVTRIKKFFKW